ncbi:hypothetical protein NIASO_14475 [Niabella soli DSM 19437]|uniref:Uncharacterized protein n=1 Tax=Niabella soli DSM 19437 TaxID=929713 RepID=W0F478_9BACT|nr:hypothetical protein NIASO_14475 [Niabella soli DSM 19437]
MEVSFGILLFSFKKNKLRKGSLLKEKFPD